MSKTTQELYPDLESAHKHIELLDATISYYKTRTTNLIDMLKQVRAITEDLE